jgi:hypothetical protein
MTALLVTLVLAAPGHDHCVTARCVTRRAHVHAHARTRRRWRATVVPFDGYLTRIARCESGLRWKINTGNGFYGGLQFTLPSWRAVGGSGYPHRASPLEQKYRAVRLSRLQGWGAWPVCGRR